MGKQGGPAKSCSIHFCLILFLQLTQMIQTDFFLFFFFSCRMFGTWQANNTLGKINKGRQRFFKWETQWA
jgi:hypothetical protein